MTATRKSMRFLTVLALICAMVLSIASTPVSAAGVETWYKGSVTEETMYTTGTNLTPLKTMGDSGKLTIIANFKLTDSSDLAYCVLEIRDSANTLLVLKHADAHMYTTRTLVASINVTQGQQLHIFTNVYDPNTFAGRQAEIVYTHTLS